MSHLKPHHPFVSPSTEPGSDAAESSLPLLLDDGAAYGVREILDSQRRGGQLEYLVDWEGYGPEECSWVPCNNIVYPNLLETFHSANPNRPAPRGRGRPPQCRGPRPSGAGRGEGGTRTTPFRPQSDGQVESFNATLQKILATTSERCHWDWDLMVPYAVMAYRATKHSSTGFTPNMMLFGREITEPIDLVAGMPPNHTLTKTFPQYVVQVKESLELAHRVARDALGRSVERAKKHYDKRAARTHYKVGDAVWFLIKGTKRVKNKIRKFLPNYDGPYFILGHLDDLVYRIQRSSRAKVKVVHHDKLKPYHSRQPLEKKLGV
ncbi:hypothetical protein QTP86_034652 [Hemibagrus guttatus]|nr:hypothetical protein QTP86_034652 [Hemibagrus guttatus]